MGQIIFQDTLLKSLKGYSTPRPNTTKDIIWLIGYSPNGDDVILLSGVKGAAEIDTQQDEPTIQSIIPAGLSVLGIYVFDISPTRKSSASDELNSVMEKINKGYLIDPIALRVTGVNKFGADVFASSEDELEFYYSSNGE
jgi:hypothetical protein